MQNADCRLQGKVIIDGETLPAAEERLFENFEGWLPILAVKLMTYLK